MSPTQRISQHHPALAGHFPGNPVVPGVVILDRVIGAAAADGHRVTAISSAKFNSPLLPEQAFSVTLEPKGERLQFAVQSDERLIAQGSLEVEAHS